MVQAQEKKNPEDNLMHMLPFLTTGPNSQIIEALIYLTEAYEKRIVKLEQILMERNQQSS